MRGPTIGFADSVFSKYIFTAADVMNVGFFVLLRKMSFCKMRQKPQKLPSYSPTKEQNIANTFMQSYEICTSSKIFLKFALEMAKKCPVNSRGQNNLDLEKGMKSPYCEKNIFSILKYREKYGIIYKIYRRKGLIGILE